MRLHKSGEDYLEVILILEQKRSYVRSSDVAEQMKVTKPSVTNATRLLKEGNGGADHTDVRRVRKEGR